jgi:hypothetical protein
VTHEVTSITVVWIIYKPGADVALLDHGRWFGFILLGTRAFVRLAGVLVLGRLGGRSIRLGLHEEKELYAAT